jgi:type VI secretion system secreted protein Hcp
MANPAYMTLYDEHKQQMHGPVQIAKRQYSVEILAFQHHIYIPTDRDTGSLTSTRKHAALEVTKAFGPLSPELYKACCDGKTLQRVRIDWYQIDNDGKERQYFSHDLHQVKVVSVQPQMRHIKDKQNDHHIHEERIAFRYEKICWIFHEGNRQASDTWNERC